MLVLKEGRKHVFIDSVGIEAGYGTSWPGSKQPGTVPTGIRIEAHRPTLGAEPVIRPDQPWENGSIGGYATFMKDEGVYRAWYECFPARSLDDMTSLLAYAESDNGADWRKPLLRRHEFAGSTENNILMSAHGTCVLKDPAAPASERYKLVLVKYDLGATDGQWCKIHGATSSDGISWKMLSQPVLVNAADTQTILSFDRESRRYVLYTRQSHSWERRFDSGRRGIARSATDDFQHWPQPEMVLTNDPADPPDWDYYTNGYAAWPGADDAHVLRISMYRRASDRIDVHLATSRDGREWYRPLGPEPWIPNGPPGSFNGATMYSTVGLVPSSEGSWISYIHCNPFGHNMPLERYPPRYGGFWPAEIREDGFTSVTADEKGEFWTVPLSFAGSRLRINANVPSAGYLRIGLTDSASGNPVAGFEPDACDPLGGDMRWRSVRWRGREDVSHLAGRPVRMHVQLSKSSLYAFRFDR